MKTHTYNNIVARLLVLLVAVLTLAPAVRTIGNMQSLTIATTGLLMPSSMKR